MDSRIQIFSIGAAAVLLFIVFVFRFERPIAQLDRIHAARDFDDRRWFVAARKMFGKPIGVMDYTKVYNLNGPIPPFGSDNISIELAADGPLAKGSAQVAGRVGDRHGRGDWRRPRSSTRRTARRSEFADSGSPSLGTIHRSEAAVLSNAAGSQARFRLLH